MKYRKWPAVNNAMIWIIIFSFTTPLIKQRSKHLANEKIYYVDQNHPQAADAKDGGTVENPWKTIGYGVAQLIAGDTLLIREGIYEESQVTLWASSSGKKQAPITVKSFPGENVIWRGNGTLIHFMDAEWWIIEGITFTGNAEDNSMIILGGSADVIARHITVRESIFKDAPMMGIRSFYAEHVIVENCHFQNLSSNLAGKDLNAFAVPQYGYDIVVRNSRFEDISSDGVHIGALGADIGRVVIENNKFWINRPYTGPWGNLGENGIDIKAAQGPITITSNLIHGFRPTVPGQNASGAGGEGMLIHWPFPDGPTAQNILVEKNHLYDNTIHLHVTNSQNITVTNNIFSEARDPVGNSTWAPGSALVVGFVQTIEVLHNTFYNNDYFLTGQEVMNGEFKNNFIWGGGSHLLEDSLDWDADFNAWGEVNPLPSGLLLGENDIEVEDPRLNQDLSLTADSPLRDSGTLIGVEDDFLDRPRIDQMPDIGAFEYYCLPIKVFLPVALRK